MLRDRRTLLTMIVVPILLMPLIIGIVATITKNRVEEAKSKDIKIAINDNGNGAELIERFKRQKDVKILDVAPDDYEALIRSDSLDLALEISSDFDAEIKSGKTADVKIFFDATDEGLFMDRMEKTINGFGDKVLKERLDSLGGNMAMITPIKTAEKNVYTQQESIGKMAGGFLPYMFVIFCLMGAMFPAIDLFTGEKERGTMETILTVPANRLQILMGKMGVIVTSGVVSGVLTILGLYLGLKFYPDIPPIVTTIANQILSPSTLALIVLMLIPLTTFFSGIMIPASIYAKSFKEAQSLIQPLTIFVILPLIVAMMPGFKLDTMTALIPVVNVALATKEIIAGTIDYGLLALVFISLFVFAGIGIAVCIRWFGSEGNILRT